MRAILTLALTTGCGPTDPGTVPDDTAETTDETPPVTFPDGVCLTHESDIDNPAMVARLETNIERAREDMNLAGLSVSATLPDGTWLAAAGIADTGEDLEKSDLFRIGSVSKVFTATVLLQLHDEGVLAIDDPLDDWLPGWWDDEGITLRHLLQHTSGIVSYNYVGNFDQAAEYEPIELVQWAKDNGPDPKFEPGSEYDYSNTGFVLLGLVIEEATGRPFHVELRERIIDPLGLDSTFFPPAEDIPCDQARGFSGGVDVTDLADTSMGWTAGGMVSTARDVNTFQLALQEGELLAPGTLAEMNTEVILPDGTGTYYGLGIFSSYDGDYGWSYGHTGGISGFSSYMYTVTGLDGSVTVLVNEEGQDLDDVVAYIWAAILDVEFP